MCPHRELVILPPSAADCADQRSLVEGVLVKSPAVLLSLKVTISGEDESINFSAFSAESPPFKLVFRLFVPFCKSRHKNKSGKWIAWVWRWVDFIYFCA